MTGMLLENLKGIVAQMYRTCSTIGRASAIDVAYRRAILSLVALTFTLIAQAAAAQAPVAPTHPNGEVALVVDFEVKRGFEDEFERYFALSTTCSRLEPGNIAFNIHKVTGATGRYVLYEIWRSPQALEEHFQRPYTIALFQMFDRALVRPVTEGGLRFISDLDPARRAAPVAGDPVDREECQQAGADSDPIPPRDSSEQRAARHPPRQNSSATQRSQ